MYHPADSTYIFKNVRRSIVLNVTVSCLQNYNIMSAGHLKASNLQDFFFHSLDTRDT